MYLCTYVMAIDIQFESIVDYHSFRTYHGYYCHRADYVVITLYPSVVSQTIKTSRPPHLVCSSRNDFVTGCGDIHAVISLLFLSKSSIICRLLGVQQGLFGSIDGGIH